MKSYLIKVLAVLFVSSFALGQGEGFLSGAPACITLKVIDNHGDSISNAHVRMSFVVINQRNANIVRTKTDELGFATCESIANDSVVIVVEKDGYYGSIIKYKLWEHGRLESSRWEPWNPVIPVILKRKSMPRTDIPRKIIVRNLEMGKEYGVDLTMGALVEPNGSGKHCDFQFTFTFERLDATHFFFLSKASIHSEAPSGFIRAPKDTQCLLRYAVEAPATGYTNRLDFIQLVKDQIRENTFPYSFEEYFFFRTKIPNESNEQETHYGILRAIEFDPDNDKPIFSFRCDYHLNGEKDDRNTEYTE